MKLEFQDAKRFLPELGEILVASLFDPSPKRVFARMDRRDDLVVKAIAVRDREQCLGAAVRAGNFRQSGHFTFCSHTKRGFML